MLDIYAPVIEQTATSFEFVVPETDQFYTRVSKIQESLPWLVCTCDQQLAGYAYAGPHRSREAYQWSAELSVYVQHNFHRRGIARALYTALIEILKLQGYYTALAGITLPNNASVGFHEALGFTSVGVYKNIGFKFGNWHSVGWWEYPIRPYAGHPMPPVPVKALENTHGWDTVIESATAMIRAVN